jgi:hypothetical protein
MFIVNKSAVKESRCDAYSMVGVLAVEGLHSAVGFVGTGLAVSTGTRDGGSGFMV